MGTDKQQTVIFISNPFGYGPTGEAIALMEELLKVYFGKVVYGASKKCLEILPEQLKSKIDIEVVNERNENSLSRFYKKYQDPLVVVYLNKIAINTAKNLHLKVLFVDSLSWMWKKIPKDYLKADIYYGWNIFEDEEKIKGISNLKLIPPALGNLPKPTYQKTNRTLIHIGGFINPLVRGYSKNYLHMLAQALNIARQKLGKSTKMIITGGEEALIFIKELLTDNLIVKTLERDKFLNTLSTSRHFVTTPGLTASLEAFVLKTPVSFLLPTNLSQWKQLRLFIKAGVAPNRLEWEDYVNYNWNFDTLDEKEAILRFFELNDMMYNKDAKKEVIVTDMVKMITNQPARQTYQYQFIKKVGINGSEEIVRDILDLCSQ